MNLLIGILIFVLGGLGLLLLALCVRFYFGRRRAEQVWSAAHFPKLENLGTVKQLSVLPLIDDLTDKDGLSVESGVSYLIRADDTTILFDAGLNQTREHPSPLLRNMEKLGVSVEQIDMVFISHLHLDHVGGMRYQGMRTFGLSAEVVNLPGKQAFLPTEMTHPSAKVEVVTGPRRIAPGIASLGVIPRQLFFFGWTLEQSLAINVEGKGLVLVIGCGHPTVQRIVERAKQLFDIPIYGIIGGLHFPVTTKPVQRYVGTDNWPWNPATKQTVETAIATLKTHQPRLMALSPHDSCTWSRAAFQQSFPGAYRDVRVGETIEL
jgi:7,8-dihydropterin-6-yl-methyl-4-(beta-D-ribofuranosyl)aminobenzene 5'-phosphate synthase